MLLTEEHIDAVRSVYEALAAPAVARDRSLQVSLRRFVFAGSKSLPEDRLIDLNICSEALFIKRGKIKGGQKGTPAAEAAGQLLPVTRCSESSERRSRGSSRRRTGCGMPRSTAATLSKGR